MTAVKIYKSLTKGELGVYKGSQLADGKVIHILSVTNKDGVKEEKQISDSTFKRWWKLSEEKTQPAEQPKKETVKPVNKEKQHSKDTGVATYFESTVEQLGGSYMKYSEPMKRVVKNRDGKTVMFYLVRPNKSLKIYFKDQLDELITGNMSVSQESTYPKQFPFRMEIPQLDSTTKKVMKSILESYI